MLQYIKPTTILQIHRILERISTSDLTQEMILHSITVEVRNIEVDPEEDDDDDTGFAGPPQRLTFVAVDSIWQWV
ncbi:hypothetical protein TorRG33x02_191060 [Trema orientale]|uniref:Uncharacterized protein n=1 Tax=Trema orientale TaxID=63057 RepID=A0A2P5EHV6_TREOI|nr:hypothetical protein TorRG33x02_191060 [Trema orientale]